MFKVSTKGKLDRVSFSAVSIAKERTQLYDSNITLTQDDADTIYDVITGSMQRTMGDFSTENFGMTLEAQNYSSDGTPLDVTTFDLGDVDCGANVTLEDLEPSLRVQTTWNRNANLYRVVSCYETNNYVADVLGTGFTRVSSSAVMVGR